MLNKSVLTAAFTTALVATLVTTSGCAVTRNQETVGAYVDDTAADHPREGQVRGRPHRQCHGHQRRDPQGHRATVGFCQVV